MKKRSTAPSVGRRQLLSAAAAVPMALTARETSAFGEEGAFNPRLLLTGSAKPDTRRRTAPARWSFELVRRTSAPARVSPTTVRADSAQLLSEPFAIWAGAGAPTPLTRAELLGLRRFLVMGGILLVDEMNPKKPEFTRGAQQQIARVLPRGSAIAIGKENVVFRSFYLLKRASGRLVVSDKLKAIVRGGVAQVLFSPNDLLGALAREAGGVYPLEAKPGGRMQREQAVRLAVNIGMYVLCSNYKDDQVHAPFLMRRRAERK